MIVIHNVLVPIDFGEASDEALIYGRHLAKTFGADLHVMHVAENLFFRPMANNPSAIQTGIGQRLAEQITTEDRNVLHAVAVMRTSDEPAEEIVQYAEHEQIDLIVMGTHGRQRMAHVLMGSVAEKVVRTAPMSRAHHPSTRTRIHIPRHVEARHDRA
jgi:nucleotide-binding universal stress UspA family protein